MSHSPSLSESALVLVGHGSSRHPDGAGPILRLAEDIRGRDRFREVAAVFMKQAPLLAEAGSLVSARQVFVVPVFAGKGYYTDTLIPREMGLSGPVTERDGRLFRITMPAGTHPCLPGILARRAELLAQAAGMAASGATLLLIAHGSGRPGGAGETPRAIAAAIAETGRFAHVALTFLEQEPFATGWPALVPPGDVVALPLLVAQGMHASQDIPPLFGLEPGAGGPIQRGPHRVLLATGMGAEPELVEVILDLVRMVAGL
jgi:sirohydrochlorin cobaltochelatase